MLLGQWGEDRLLGAPGRRAEGPSQGRRLTSPWPAGKAQANEQRYSKLKEKYSELVQNHADLLRKVGPYSRPQASPGPELPLLGTPAFQGPSPPYPELQLGCQPHVGLPAPAIFVDTGEAESEGQLDSDSSDWEGDTPVRPQALTVWMGSLVLDGNVLEAQETPAQDTALPL